MKNTVAATPNYRVTTNVVKNIVLEGVKTLRVEKITTTFKVEYELHPKTNQPFKVVSKDQVDKVVEPMFSFELVEVTPEKLAVYRRSNISSFVLKVDGKLYYTRIPDNISFVSSNILGAHQCGVCNRLSAASDKKGGCAKVRARSQGIERYPWITTGYETFNTKHDSFVVATCLHYEQYPPRKKIPISASNSAKLSLAQLVWDDVTSREEVAKRVEANHKKYGTTY